MEGNKDTGDAVVPVPVDYVIEEDKTTKRPEESSHKEDGKG